MDGKWQNETGVDSAWIVKATTPVFEVPGMKYGYNFYVSAYEEYPGFGSGGHGGQAIYVVPEKKLVVVITAWPYMDSGPLYTDEGDDMFFLIYDSCY